MLFVRHSRRLSEHSSVLHGQRRFGRVYVYGRCGVQVVGGDVFELDDARELRAGCAGLFLRELDLHVLQRRRVLHQCLHVGAEDVRFGRARDVRARQQRLLLLRDAGCLHDHGVRVQWLGLCVPEWHDAVWIGVCEFDVGRKQLWRVREELFQ